MSTAPGRAKQLADSARSDEQLVRDCLKGKDSAWSALIFKYKNLIFSIPIPYGFSEEDAADIFQAVCMDLLAELPRLREPKALAWLPSPAAAHHVFWRQTIGIYVFHQTVTDSSDKVLTAEQVGSRSVTATCRLT